MRFKPNNPSTTGLVNPTRLPFAEKREWLSCRANPARACSTSCSLRQLLLLLCMYVCVCVRCFTSYVWWIDDGLIVQSPNLDGTRLFEFPLLWRGSRSRNWRRRRNIWIRLVGQVPEAKKQASNLSPVVKFVSSMWVQVNGRLWLLRSLGSEWAVLSLLTTKTAINSRTAAAAAVSAPWEQTNVMRVILLEAQTRLIRASKQTRLRWESLRVC